MSSTLRRALFISAGISNASEAPRKTRTVADGDPFGVILKQPFLSSLFSNRVPTGCS